MPSSIWAEIEADENCFLTSHSSYFNSRYLALNDSAARMLSWYQFSSYWIGVSFVPGNICSCLVKEKKPPPNNPKMRELAHFSLSHLLLHSAKGLFSSLQILTVCRIGLGFAWWTRMRWRKTVWCHLSFHPVKSWLCELVSSHSTI